jgi:hypothetical protein
MLAFITLIRDAGKNFGSCSVKPVVGWGEAVRCVVARWNLQSSGQTPARQPAPARCL